MGANFFPISSPPQSIDTLDAWGSIDALAWSLDASVWNTAGIYGLQATAGGVSGGATAGQRTRTDSFAGMAAAGGSALGNILHDIAGAGAVTASEIAVFEHIIVQLISEPAVSGGEAFGVCVYEIAGVADAISFEDIAYLRIRQDAPTGAAAADGEADISRILMLLGAGDAVAEGTLQAEYKGWAWQKEPAPVAGAWAVFSAGGQQWGNVTGGAAQWRGVVQWQ